MGFCRCWQWGAAQPAGITLFPGGSAWRLQHEGGGPAVSTCHIPSCLPAGQDQYRHEDAGCHCSVKVCLYTRCKYTQYPVEQITPRWFVWSVHGLRERKWMLLVLPTCFSISPFSFIPSRVASCWCPVLLSAGPFQPSSRNSSVLAVLLHLGFHHGKQWRWNTASVQVNITFLLKQS